MDGTVRRIERKAIKLTIDIRETLKVTNAMEDSGEGYDNCICIRILCVSSVKQKED